MKTDAELETLLRATLGGRARAVPRGPDWSVPAASHRRTWLAGLGAAASVAAIGVTLAVLPSSHRPTPPTSQLPSTPSTVTTTAPPTSCAARLPQSWLAALNRGVVRVGGTTARPLSVGADGGLLVARDFGPQPGRTRDVVLVRPGRATRTVYTVADPDRDDVQSAVQSGSWVVVTVARSGRPPAGTVPGNSTLPNAHRIVVVDLRDGSTRTVGGTAGRTGGFTVNAAVVVGSTVLWDEKTSYAATDGVIRSYDLRTRRTTTVYRGGGLMFFPTVSAAGLFVAGRRVGPAPALPPIVARAMTSVTLPTLAGDGTSWAWFASAHVVGFWRPGLTAPAYAVVPGDPLVGPDVFPTPPVVSGRLVVIDARLVDATNHAYARIPASPRRFFVAAGSGAVLAGGQLTTTRGRFVGGYWLDPPQQILRIATAGLPALRC